MKSKRVLVTGADGFIGSHLVESLLYKGYQVRALALYNSLGSWGWLDHIGANDQLEIVTGDVRDYVLCEEITKDVDIVFHLAALIAIPFSYRAPNLYVETNISGTMNMCQAARRNGVRKFIQTSTSEVYGSALYVPIDEKHPYQPQSPYSASKISSDNMALSFYYTYDLDVTVARPFNTYGPRQSARAIIPTIITQILSGVSEIKLGDVSPTRDFNYVKDTCSGFIRIAETDGLAGEIINIGSGIEITVKDTLELIKELTDSDVKYILDDERIRPEKSEVNRLCCDNSKMKKLTGFEPEYNLRSGLSSTIDWFRVEENLKLYKPDIYNV